jgi:hypothetical protein
MNSCSCQAGFRRRRPLGSTASGSFLERNASFVDRRKRAVFTAASPVFRKDKTEPISVIRDRDLKPRPDVYRARRGLEDMPSKRAPASSLIRLSNKDCVDERSAWFVNDRGSGIPKR